MSSKKLPTLKEVEKEHIERGLARFKGNMSKAALALGMGRATLYRKLKEYGLTMTPYRKVEDEKQNEGA